eukprot:Gb_02261 [translate_table: standard]
MILISLHLSEYPPVLSAGYADAGSSTDVIAGDRSWKSMEMEIQSLLEKLLDTNDAMSRCAAAATPTTSVTQKLARHRDILHEFTQARNISVYAFSVTAVLPCI